MIILRQNNYSKTDLNKLGWKTDHEIREAVEGTKAEKKVDKILDKSAREMKEASQKEYTNIQNTEEKLKDIRNPKIKINQQYKKPINPLKQEMEKRQSKSVRIGFKKFSKTSNPGIMTIEDIFSIIRRGTVATGKVESGNFKVGDKVEISDGKNKIQTSIKGLEIWRKTVDEVSEGDSVGILFPFPEISKNDIKRGMVIKVVSPDQKQFSKQDREVVPADIVKKVKDGGGVIQKDHNGDWRIISMKTKTNKSGKPEFWNNAKFKTKAQAEDCLQAYWVNKRK